jgi:signal transduction histidine kinase
MLASAEVMLISKEDIPGSHLSAAVRIRNAAKWIRSMLDDLLDFTRTRFGSPLPIVREAVDLTAVCRQFVGEMQAVYPDWKIRLDCEGDLQGSFDPRRIGQIMANLFASAARYGDARFPVTVTARREGDEAVLSVHNKGEPIPAGPLRIIFSPMAEGGARNGQPGSDRRLGLGLYIAKEIAEAHDGRIGVTSNRAAGTTFELRLPHRPC